MNLTDEQLARRWRSGDAEAGAALVRRYAQAAGSAAFAVLGDMGLAEDIVQTVYEKANARIQSLRDTRAAGAWLVSIARRSAIDVLRRRGREAPIGDFNVADPRRPDADAAHNEAGDAIRLAVAQLNDDQRELFMMKYVGGMRHEAIATAMGTTPDAVGQRLARIRKRLRCELEAFRP